MEKGLFYNLIPDPESKKIYKLEKFSLDSYQTQTNIAFNNKIPNTYNAKNVKQKTNVKTQKNVKTAKTEKGKAFVKTEEENVDALESVKTPVKTTNNKKNETKKRKNVKNNVLSTVDNFSTLEPYLGNIKHTKIKLLYKKLKYLKMKKNHLFFFVQDNKIRLVLKEHIFKNGLLILQTIIYV